MTWQWRRQGRIPLVNIVAGKNSSNRMRFCKKDNIAALRIKRDTLQKDPLTRGLLYLAEGLMYLAEGGPKNGHPIEVLLLGLETPGDPEVLLSVWTWVVWGQVRCLQHPQVLVHPQIGCQKVPMYGIVRNCLWKKPSALHSLIMFRALCPLLRLSQNVSIHYCYSLRRAIAWVLTSSTNQQHCGSWSVGGLLITLIPYLHTHQPPWACPLHIA